MSGVSRDHPLPLWRQLKEEVRGLIASGLEPGDQIPGENELGDRYGLSRTVVRHAIDSLVNDGVLFRRQGHGTFVAPRKLEQNLVGERGADGLYRTSIGELDSVFLSAEETFPSSLIKRYLPLSDRDVIFEIRRLRLAGDEPIALQFDVVPRRVCPTLIADTEGLPKVGRTLSETHGLRAATVIVSVEGVPADSEVAHWLEIPEGAPLITVHRVFSLGSGEALRYCRTQYRHHRFTLKFPAFRIS